MVWMGLGFMESVPRSYHVFSDCNSYRGEVKVPPPKKELRR